MPGWGRKCRPPKWWTGIDNYSQREGSDSPEEAPSRTQKVVAGHANSFCHVLFGLLQVIPGIIELLVSDLSIDLQNRIVVFHHVAHDGSGEGVLGIGIHIHLDDSILQRFPNLLEKAPTPPMEDKIHLGIGPIFLNHRGLPLTQDFRTKLHRSRLIVPVDVPKGRGATRAGDCASSRSKCGGCWR